MVKKYISGVFIIYFTIWHQKITQSRGYMCLIKLLKIDLFLPKIKLAYRLLYEDALQKSYLQRTSPRRTKDKNIENSVTNFQGQDR